jgi:sarcosine oxidase subunit delta
MAFLLRCPQCGPRDVTEFRWGGEQSTRPAPGSPPATWTDYLYTRRNEAGVQQEWWYHRAGCRRWFVAVRDTRVNRVERTFWPSPETPGGSGAAAGRATAASPPPPPATGPEGAEP